MEKNKKYLTNKKYKFIYECEHVLDDIYVIRKIIDLVEAANNKNRFRQSSPLSVGMFVSEKAYEKYKYDAMLDDYDSALLLCNLEG